MEVFTQQKQQVEQAYSGQLSQLQKQQQEVEKSLKAQARKQVGSLESQKQQALAEVYKQEELSRRRHAIGGIYAPLTETKKGIESKATGLQEAVQTSLKKGLEGVAKQVEKGQASLSKWKQESLASIEEAEAEWKANNVRLNNGEWVPKTEFNALPPEYQTKLRQLGVDRFNKEVEAEREKVETAMKKLKPFKTSEGKYNLTEALNKGIDEQTLLVLFTPEQVKAAKKVKAENVEVGPNEWVSREKFESLTPDEQALLLKVGLAEYNKRAEQSQKDYEEFTATHVEVKPGVWYNKKDWEALNASQQQEVITTGEYTIPEFGSYVFQRMQIAGEIPKDASFVNYNSKDRTVTYFVPGVGTTTIAETGTTIENVPAPIKGTTASAESELSKLPPELKGVALAAAGAILVPEPISSAAGGVAMAALAATAVFLAARGVITSDIDWSKAFGELRGKIADAFTIKRHSGVDVSTTKVETHPETGTIEITPAQTAVDGQVQTFILEQQKLEDFTTTFPLEQVKSPTTEFPTEQPKLADYVTKLPLEQTKPSITKIPIEQMEPFITKFPLEQQKLEDTISKAIAVASAATATIHSIPVLDQVLTADEVRKLTSLKEHYLSSLNDAIQAPSISAQKEFYTHMSDTRFAILQLLDKLLEEGRIDQTQYKLFQAQLRAWEGSEAEFLKRLENYFSSVEELQSITESSIPSDFSPIQKEQVAAAVLASLTQLHGLPKPASGDTASRYITKNFIMPKTAIPVTDMQSLTQELTSIATRAATQAASKTAVQNLSATQTAAAIQAATRAAVQAAVQEMAITKTLTKAAVNTAVDTAVAGAILGRRIPRIPPLPGVPSKKKAPITVPDGTWTWKQGFGWRWYPPPYNAKKPYFSFYPPIGAKNTHLETPAETIQIIGNPTDVPDQVEIDLGITDILLLKSPKPTITFKGRGLVTDVGTRIPSTTQGLSITEDKLPKLPQVKLSIPKLETIRLPSGPFEVYKTQSLTPEKAKEGQPGLAEVK